MKLNVPWFAPAVVSLFGLFALALLGEVATDHKQRIEELEALLTPKLKHELKCPRLHNKKWLRWYINHQYSNGFEHHDCAWGPVWLEVANEINGH